ncbi:hypothetical protein [Chitinophaga sp. MM2321]|uniref:hypothetical protein n=1 Tax=Chitinophaga sp. MM2321 TaxID=3137178 RepID=UPI0032D5A714
MKYIKYAVAVALFLASCTSPDRDNLNEKASVQAADELPENPLLLIPITFSINPKEGSMSTLYGNNEAMQHAKLNSGNAYPAGSVLYEVTWKQKSDSLWYGANIPDQIIRVERVVFNGDALPGYELYSGHPLRKVAFPSSAQRIALITAQQMAHNP